MQVGGLSQKDIMSEWKRAFLISQTSRAKPMEQREQKPNLFGLCRVVTEEGEANCATNAMFLKAEAKKHSMPTI